MGVTSIIFEETSHLEEIQTSAFKGTQISTLSLPSSLKYIHTFAFDSCESLTRINFGNNIELIDSSAFTGSSVTQLQFPDSLQSIGNSAFERSSKLSAVIFGSGLNSIGEKAFSETKISYAEIPINTKYISDSAFANSELQSLAFASPSNIEDIPKNSFKNCKKLARISFAPETKSINEGSFEGCSNLESIEIGRGIETISTNSFKDCTSLLVVIIPDPSALKSIGSLAFDGCKNLKQFNVSKDHPSFSTEEGVLFDKEKTQIILYLPAHERNNFTVPDSVSEIIIYAFQNAVNLVSVRLPESIKKIGYGAFEGCIGLQTVNIPTGLDEIGSMAFNKCNSLKCGSIEHDSNQRQWLIDNGVPKAALTPCMTKNFSICTEAENYSALLLAGGMFSDDNCHFESE